MAKTKDWDALIRQAENELERLKLERQIALLDRQLAALKPFIRQQQSPSQPNV